MGGGFHRLQKQCSKRLKCDGYLKRTQKSSFTKAAENIRALVEAYIFTHLPRILAGFNRLMATQISAPVEQKIRQKLQETFQPKFLEVINESYMHNVPKGSETHFKVVVVSEKFDSQPLIKRHQMVNEVLKEELSSGVHALSIMLLCSMLES